MPNASVIIFNASREPVADLHNASGVGYEQRINELHRAWFNLPIDDPHVSECTGMRYAEIWDGDERVDLFRIVRKRKRRIAQQTYYRFECEHVLVTLMDSRLQATTYSGPGTSTSISDVLGEQGTANWQLGTCDFNRQFLYKWKPGTSLLKALIDIPARFGCAYQWTWDTTTHPWTLNLIEPPSTVTAYLDYSRNLKIIEKDEDFRGLYTRLYPYGAGAGADQLNITTIEPSGHDYIENNVVKYGLIVGPRWSDQRYTVAQNLYDAAVDKLARASVPKVTYTVSAADLYRLTKVSTDQFVLGALLAVNDADMGITIEARIVLVSKPDLGDKPGDVTIQIANKSEEFDLRGFIEVNDLSALQMVDIPGGIVGALPATPDVEGLYACTDYFGFSDGTNWITYMDKTGKLWAEHGGYYIHFDPAASPPLQIKADGEWLGSLSISQLTAGDLTVGMNLKTGGYVKSDNFVTGVSGWKINPDGTAEFQNATIRGTLNASDLTAGTLDFAALGRTGLAVITDEIANGAVTDAKIDTLTVSKITAGNIAVAWNLTTGGSIKSNDYVYHSAGWRITPSGTAEFNNVYVRGDLDASDLSTGTIDFATISRSGMSVIADEIANGAVTDAKIDTVSVSKLLAGNINVAWNLTAGGSVKSDNYVAGVSGWKVNSNGSAEFRDVTIRGSLNADDLDAGTIDFATISRSGMSVIADEIADGAVTNAKIDTVEVDKLTAGDVNVEWNFVIGGSMKSDNYIAGTSGWEIRSNGSAEFQNVTVRGSLNADDLDAGTLDFTALGRTGLFVITDEIANGAVTNAKIDTIVATKITTGGLVSTDWPTNGWGMDLDAGYMGCKRGGNAVFQFWGSSGDLEIGNTASAHYMKWDDSEGTLTVRGTLNADDIVAGTITGRVVQTATSGTRIMLQIEGTWAHELLVYGGEVLETIVGRGSIDFPTGGQISSTGNMTLIAVGHLYMIASTGKNIELAAGNDIELAAGNDIILGYGGTTVAHNAVVVAGDVTGGTAAGYITVLIGGVSTRKIQLWQ